MPADPARPPFLDTNVLVYAFSDDPRSEIAERLMSEGFVVGVQGLNEFANVARRKLGMSWLETTQALAAIRTLATELRPLDVETHEHAMELAERHSLPIFDALILAAALRASCTTFWSEDMQDGFVVEGRLLVANPFAASRPRPA